MNENENTMIKNLWVNSKSSSKRVYSHINLKQPKLTPKGIRRNKQNPKFVEGKKS